MQINLSTVIFLAFVEALTCPFKTLINMIYFLAQICGILLIILGSLMISNIGDFANFSDAANTDTIPILIIVLGCVIFVISFFGCCGAIRENVCCTMTVSLKHQIPSSCKF